MSNTTDYIKYLTNRANNGDTKAQYSLGVAYYEGKIIAKNLTLSQKWFSLAAQNGNLEAEVGLALLCEAKGNYMQAHGIMKKAAKRGCVTAQSNLGITYSRGNPCVKQDYYEAAKWMTKAAKQGEPEALSNLAGLYANGLGVQKNIAKALKLWEESANKNYAPAQTNLGFVYFLGNIVRKDYAQAESWLLKALWNGVMIVLPLLGEIYATGGHGITQDYRKAYFYYNIAYNSLDTFDGYSMFNVVNNTYGKYALISKSEIKKNMMAIEAVINAQ